MLSHCCAPSSTSGWSNSATSPPTPYVRTAMPGGCSCASSPRADIAASPISPWRLWTPAKSQRSCSTASASARSRSARATAGSPRYAAFSPSSPSASLRPSRSAPKCCESRPRRRPSRPAGISSSTRSRQSSSSRTAACWKGSATTRCYGSSTTRVRAFRRRSMSCYRRSFRRTEVRSPVRQGAQGAHLPPVAGDGPVAPGAAAAPAACRR